MNKGELIEELAQKTGFTKKDSKLALNSIVEIVEETLENNGEVMLTGFGKFETRPRKATERINPQTREKVQVPAKVVPKFKTGKNLEERVEENLVAVEKGSGELEVEVA